MALHQHERPASFLSEGKDLYEHICEQSWSRHKAPMTVARRLRTTTWYNAAADMERRLPHAKVYYCQVEACQKAQLETCLRTCLDALYAP